MGIGLGPPNVECAPNDSGASDSSQKQISLSSLKAVHVGAAAEALQLSVQARPRLACAFFEVNLLSPFLTQVRPGDLKKIWGFS